MELDTGIIYLLIFFFIVLPSLIRRKKRTAASKQKKTGIGLGKLGETLRGFLRELEKQALEAKKKAAQQGESKPGSRGPSASAGERSIWEMLDDRDDDSKDIDNRDPEEAETLPDPAPVGRAAVEKKPPLATAETIVRSSRASRKHRAGTKEKGQRPKAPAPTIPAGAALPPHRLQQAIVWSEILRPPKALRQE